ncbi:hypothetical protein Mal64_01420 [Pseudobythopirellula maris]|uniref:Uncharacterized protein n=1 Tax=Pseudobythopirellula maris TaxID=2527991 RepID=A0A5C5ZUC0_9BACT|nr:hypothetical protein [Pseudobythopirellula maris]TWT89763.1 hypothetical protein Mal64_01420 [Pseudobythopirellula maris]
MPSVAGVLPSHAGGMTFGWEVLYHPHDVTIRLADVGVAVPEPGGLLLAACGVLDLLRRRRTVDPGAAIADTLRVARRPLPFL